MRPRRAIGMLGQHSCSIQLAGKVQSDFYATMIPRQHFGRPIVRHPEVVVGGWKIAYSLDPPFLVQALRTTRFYAPAAFGDFG